MYVYQNWYLFSVAVFLSLSFLIFLQFLFFQCKRQTDPEVCVCMCVLTFFFFLQPQHTNVCFWYIPPSLRGMPDGDERREKLHRVRRFF